MPNARSASFTGMVHWGVRWWSEGGTPLILIVFGASSVALGVLPTEHPTRTVAGKPSEVRSFSKTVVMPSEGAFRYRCWKDEGKGSGTCPGERRWATLPRWPEPLYVKMEVRGREIRSLSMDGETIVAAAEFRQGDRFHKALNIVIGAIVCGVGILIGRSRWGRADKL